MINPLLSTLLALFLGLQGRLSALLTIGLAGAAFSIQWYKFGVQFDFTDVCLLTLMVALPIRARSSLGRAWRSLPYRWPWVILVVLSAFAYAKAPLNSEFFSSPLSMLYQIYRYSIRSLLFFPLAAMLITEKSKALMAILVLTLAVDIVALQSVLAYRQGVADAGFFNRNYLGGAYLLSYLSCIAGIVTSKKISVKALCIVTILLLTRSLLYATSRGSWAGIILASTLLLLYMGWSRFLRGSIFRWAAIAILGFFLVLVPLKPDLLDRPNVKGLLTLKSPLEDGNLQWRMTERWPHFWNLCLENPWFGTGIPYDPSLGESGHTPHNTYLGIAVGSGLPVLALFAFLTASAARSGLILARFGSGQDVALMGMVGLAYLAGIAVNGLVESTLQNPFISSVFWSVVGVTLATRYRVVPSAAALRRSARAGGTRQTYGEEETA